MDGYEPGKCNIAGSDVRLRFYSSAVLFLVVAAFVGMIFLYPSGFSGGMLYLSLFFVSLSAFLTYFQYRNRFCTGLALRGREKIGEKAEKVEDSEKVRRDRKKAALIFGQSLVFSCVLTGAVYLTVVSSGFLPILG